MRMHVAQDKILRRIGMVIRLGCVAKVQRPIANRLQISNLPHKAALPQNRLSRITRQA